MNVPHVSGQSNTSFVKEMLIFSSHPNTLVFNFKSSHIKLYR